MSPNCPNLRVQTQHGSNKTPVSDMTKFYLIYKIGSCHIFIRTIAFKGSFNNKIERSFSKIKFKTEN